MWSHEVLRAAIKNTGKTDKTDLAADTATDGGTPKWVLLIIPGTYEVVPGSVLLIKMRAKGTPCSITVLPMALWLVWCGLWKLACVMRRHVGKGIQGACAPMAERWAGALLRRGAAGAAIGDLGALRALGGAR